MKKDPNSIDRLQPFRRLFDKAIIDRDAAHAVHTFICKCLKENGLPSCMRVAIGRSHPQGFEFDSYYTTQAFVAKLPSDDIFLANIMANIESRDSGEKALVMVDCIMGKTFGKTVVEHFKDFGDERLDALCESLNVDKEDMTDVSIALLHRSQELIEEALCHKHRYDHVIYAIHSFSKSGKDFQEFKAFSKALDIPVKGPGILSEPKKIVIECDGLKLDEDVIIQFHLVWVNNETFSISNW